MTDEQRKLVERYIEKEDIEFPDMTPTKSELENPVPLLKELPMRQASVPKAVSWNYFWSTGITTIINNLITAFGFGLCAQRDSDGNVVGVYPVRTNSRGLNDASTNIGLEHFERFLAENAKVLYDESYVAEKNLLAAAEAYRDEIEKSKMEEENEQPHQEPEVMLGEYPKIRQTSDFDKSVNKKTSRFLRERLESDGIDVDAAIATHKIVNDIPGDNPPTATFSIEAEESKEVEEMPTSEIIPDDSSPVEVNSIP